MISLPSIRTITTYSSHQFFNKLWKIGQLFVLADFFAERFGKFTKFGFICWIHSINSTTIFITHTKCIHGSSKVGLLLNFLQSYFSANFCSGLNSASRCASRASSSSCLRRCQKKILFVNFFSFYFINFDLRIYLLFG